MTKLREYKRTTCDFRGCEEPRFMIGERTIGVCHRHLLAMPVGLRREWSSNKDETPERVLAEDHIMAYHIGVGNSCVHHKFHNDGPTQKDNALRCFECYPKTEKENQHVNSWN